MNKFLVAIITVCALATSACTQAKHAETVVKDDAIACAKQDLGQTVEDAGLSLAYAVAGIIFQGGTNWQADLDSLAAKYGPDALACAAKIASDLFHPPAAGSASGPATADDAFTAVEQRAQEALAKYAHGRALK